VVVVVVGVGVGVRIWLKVLCSIEYIYSHIAVLFRYAGNNNRRDNDGVLGEYMRFFSEPFTKTVFSFSNCSMLHNSYSPLERK
jgi:hypothetical protein